MAYWVKYSGSELMNGLFWVKYSALWGGLTDIRRGEPECARHHQNWNFPLRCQCILFPNEMAILCHLTKTEKFENYFTAFWRLLL